MIQNNEYIRYIGEKSSLECNNIINNFIDVICLPRVNCEVCNLVTPVKIYQAVSYKKIVVCSSVNPLNDIVIDKHTGYVFDKKDENTLYDTLMYILNNKSSTTQVRKQLYNNLKNNTWEKNIKNVLHFIHLFKVDMATTNVKPPTNGVGTEISPLSSSNNSL